MIIENNYNEYLLTVSKQEAVELIRSLAETLNVTRGDAFFHQPIIVSVLKNKTGQLVGRQTTGVLTVKVKA
jgi:hypothetical protein